MRRHSGARSQNRPQQGRGSPDAAFPSKQKSPAEAERDVQGPGVRDAFPGLLFPVERRFTRSLMEGKEPLENRCGGWGVQGRGQGGGGTA